MLSSKNNEVSLKIEDLYKHHKLTMLYAANQVLHDLSLAEDAVQTAFIRIMNNLHKIDEINSNRTRKFLVIIVRNVAINIYNSIKEKSEQFYSPGDLVNEPASNILLEDIIISDESLQRIQDCIVALDKKHADVLHLKYTYDYSEQEIAQLLNISYENVRVRLHRAKKKLREELGKEG